MLDTYGLHENAWLGSLYSDRRSWVPAYVRDTFWAGMSTTQRSESMNAFFDDYVNSKTTLKQFVDQYDSALRRKVENEAIADFNSFNTEIPCISRYPLEKQFQKAYKLLNLKKYKKNCEDLYICLPRYWVARVAESSTEKLISQLEELKVEYPSIPDHDTTMEGTTGKVLSLVVVRSKRRPPSRRKVHPVEKTLKKPSMRRRLQCCESEQRTHLSDECNINGTQHEPSQTQYARDHTTTYFGNFGNFG
ncbi:hypothetical protein F2P56_015473, partial [Juglans regia]